MMSSDDRIITLRDLVESYVESLRPQVHPVMTDHVQKMLAAFELALGVTVPRAFSDVPERMGALYMLFRATIDSLLAFRTPLSNFLEAALIFSQLDAAGAAGQSILRALERTADGEKVMLEAQVTIAETLLQIFYAGSRPSVTMADVRATGIYPGDSPKDCDIFDHM